MESAESKQTVFVGSSHEGLHEAELVCAALKACDKTIDPRLWTNFFEAGSLTFEALEDMLLQCCGAVFVFRPDDVVRHIASTPPHTRAAHMPRGNVLLEFGLVAGRIGRRNVARVRFDKAVLPTDLASMTVIDVDHIDHADSNQEKLYPGLCSDESQEKLRIWASRLLSTAARIPRTSLFHGYTGQWEFQLRLNKWHSVLIQGASYAILNGSLDIFISSDGESGHGFAHGVLSYYLEVPVNNSAQLDRFTGDLQIIHEIKAVDCKTNGGVELLTHTLGMYPIAGGGNQWPELQRNFATEPWTFTWELTPGGQRELTGTLKTNASGGTEGDLVAKKRKLD